MYDYVRVQHGQIHFATLGEDRDVLCLFHETPVSCRYFGPSMPALSQRFRVIAFDTPGYGRSSPLNGPASIEAYADSLWQAIMQLGLRRIAVAGVHTGAALSVELMRQHPDSIVAAVLSGVPLLDQAQRARLRAHVAQSAVDVDAESLSTMWMERKARWVDAPNGLLVEAMASELQVFDRRSLGLSAVADYDAASALRACRSPTLILNGRKDSLISSDERVAALFPHCSLKILESRGGQLPWTASSEYSAELIDFLSPRFAAVTTA